MNNTIVIDDYNDLDHLIEIMDTYHDSSEPFYGNNTQGEDIQLSIFQNLIVLVTYQDNHWIRKNYYHRDGTIEEMFDGRWT